MTETSGTSRQWSIGELAKACGVTVRTLHHYDEIGLLSASKRTTSDHRRYTEQDLHRLYRIRALQMLGLSLEDIRSALGSPADDLASLRGLLERQLQKLQDHAANLQLLQRQIGELLHRIDKPTMPDPEDFMSALEMITVFENHFTSEQLKELADRRAELGAATIEAAKHEWASLVEEGLRLVQDGTPAHDPSAQDLVRRWDTLGSSFHSGEQTKTAARAMWQENSVELSSSLPWSAVQLTALVAYLQKARAILLGT